MAVSSVKPLRLSILRGAKPPGVKVRMLRLFNQGRLGLETPAKMQEALQVFTDLQAVPELKDEAIAAFMNVENQIAELKTPEEAPPAPPVAPPAKAEEVLDADAAGAVAEIELIEKLETAEKPENALATLNELASLDEFDLPIRLLVATVRWIEIGNKDIDAAISQVHAKLPAANYILTNAIKEEINLPADGVFGNIYIGAKRTTQEDGMACFEVNGKQYRIIVDGMGGHKGGGTAAWLALSETMIAIENGAELEPAIRIAHQRVYEFSQEVAANFKAIHGQELDSPPGSTIVAMEIDGDIVRTAHAGDSKIYLAKEDGRVLLLTYPHSMIGDLVEGELRLPKVQVVFGEEVIEKLESYKNAPHASQINSGLGVAEKIKHLSVHEITLEPGDRLLACTDGLESLAFAEIKKIITDRSGESVEVLGRRLAEASEKSKPRDNSTFFLVESTFFLVEKIAKSADPATQVGNLDELARQSADQATSDLLDQVASLKQQLTAAEGAQKDLSTQLRTVRRELAGHQAALDLARQDEHQIPYYIEALEQRRSDLHERGKNIRGEIARLEAENDPKIIALQAAIGDKALEMSGAETLIATRRKDYEARIEAENAALKRDIGNTEQASLKNILRGGHQQAVASIKERMDSDPVIVALSDGLANFEAEKDSMRTQLSELQDQARLLEEQFASLEGEVVTFYRDKIAAPLQSLRSQGTALKLAWMDTDFENGKG